MGKKIDSFDDFKNKKFRKGNKVKVNPELVKQNLDTRVDKANLLGLKDRGPELYQKALDGEIAVVTSAVNADNGNGYISLKFEDGFECSTRSRCLTKV